ncbi:glycosyltransferase family 4 protein [Chromohalobacter canadensis]|uniref:glycosyltransferase family 4 protein n=1 Tax=Chromohalobacter canadensis TaxID=141389 RepID=UPI0021C1E36E|nr:glycosyltransferase family 4 protein [Chromohalobacter canadensis]MCT8469811.1 glycosyltransferase family 4 protein [Chromohalobacter canadensis]MCT8472354.1 glycosyltransferase family 4 protein [Chromohalobacter canadensis]MCT8499533.1 glycosyltransferase family 4 protein [Chromohalobacter canadensis]
MASKRKKHAPNKHTPRQVPRKPRILWANPFCLLDTSSGASMSIREMLRQLAARGYEVGIVGATSFDAPKGVHRLRGVWDELQGYQGKVVRFQDDPLIHDVVVTNSTVRSQMTASEESAWLNLYTKYLDSFQPDLVFYYGGQTLDLLIPHEARLRGIPSAAYVVNGNYNSTNWCRDNDLVITDTKATSEYYKKNSGFHPVPVGKFIPKESVVPGLHQRKNLLFINPSRSKGAGIVVQLAWLLEQRRPDINFEIVESRGNWAQLVRQVTQELGDPRDALSNVAVTPNTDDMRPIYERARVLLAPSLWWESGARVLAESMLNGIPAIVTNHGGNPEMIQDGGIIIDLPAECFDKPYDHVPSNEALEPIIENIISLFDDEAHYDRIADNAKSVGEQLHNIEISVSRLTDTFEPLLAKRSGDKDFAELMKRQHKHSLYQKLPGVIYKKGQEPTVYDLKKINITDLTTPDNNEKESYDTRRLVDTDNLILPMRIIALDNGARLAGSSTLSPLLKTNAFSIISFDPDGHLNSSASLPSHEEFKYYPNAMLGDGSSINFHHRIDPSLSSSIPMEEEGDSGKKNLGARVIHSFPIPTICLDKITGLPTLDWLVLDGKNSAIQILKNGAKLISSTLVIDLEEIKKPSLHKSDEIEDIEKHLQDSGFIKITFNDLALDKMECSHQGSLATEAQPISENHLFIPSKKHCADLSDIDRTKLFLILKLGYPKNSDIEDYIYDNEICIAPHLTDEGGSSKEAVNSKEAIMPLTSGKILV